MTAKLVRAATDMADDVEVVSVVKVETRCRLETASADLTRKRLYYFHEIIRERNVGDVPGIGECVNAAPPASPVQSRQRCVEGMGYFVRHL